MKVQAEASLYALRTEHLSETVERFIAYLRRPGLELTCGHMSSHIAGDSEILFAGLREAFEQVAQHADVVLEVKISNACSGKD